MKILFHNYYNALNINNLLFECSNAGIGDNLLKPFNVLAKIGESTNIEVGTFSKIPKEEADAFVFIDYPKANDSIFNFALKKSSAKCYLLILESPIVNVKNFDLKLHEHFAKVFTWSDDLVQHNPAKYIKIQYSYDIPNQFSTINREKLCAIISGNKLSKLPNELYTERLKCIKWYNKNAPELFDLYGLGWDIVKFENESFKGKLLNRINIKYKVFKINFKIYRGPIERKAEIMSQYRFSICFENVANYNGYITEKIFDCLFAGTIPIYKGAGNVLNYVPQSCFIDYNQFENIGEMHKYIKSMSETDIQEYQKNILEYLQGDDIQQFSIKCFCDTLLKNIV